MPPAPSLLPTKAVVVLFLGGGVDSFNLLTPYGECEAKTVKHSSYSSQPDSTGSCTGRGTSDPDCLWKEYESVRGQVSPEPSDSDCM